MEIETLYIVTHESDDGIDTPAVFTDEEAMIAYGTLLMENVMSRERQSWDYAGVEAPAYFPSHQTGDFWADLETLQTYLGDWSDCWVEVFKVPSSDLNRIWEGPIPVE
jgi:hypothetical protein